MSDETHGVRLDKVETEVQTITREMGGLKSDMSGIKAGMRGLGDILQRIDASVSAAQQQWQDDKQASRINPIALTTVLISIISILVGGAWLVSGAIARQDERSIHQQQIIDRVEQRQWAISGRQQGGSDGRAPATNSQ